MAGLRLFVGNRLEKLAAELAEVLRRPLLHPLEPELTVVQSRGMERWLSMELARRHGICANYRFVFPNAFVRDLFQRLLPDVPEHSPFDRDIMTWRIMKRLPGLLQEPGFEHLKNYLGGTRPDLKIFQLSQRISDAFDQYLLFRPEMIGRWEKGRGRHWQAVLWRELVKGRDGTHRAALARDLHRSLNDPSLRKQQLPQRVSVFGISSLPGFHLGILADLSRFSEVNLFLMNPCREYWGDILSGWEMKSKGTGAEDPHQIAERLHLERGNSLLSSMGTLGRDFFERVTDLECEEFSAFEDPGEKTLLACIQSDILNLRDREGPGAGKALVSPDDRSVRIHSCHSPMREMEVLRDQLLDLFERDKTLAPHDILVMAPDIETYSPYIQAVFDLPQNDTRRIPFAVADRSIRHESVIIETFLAILDLRQGRLGASQVLSVLESEPVRRRFGLSEADLDQIRRWVRETGIRWGINGESRREMGLPPFPENTWEAGLERLLLGYAMPGGEEKMFQGILPYDHLGGGEGPLLGSFMEFTKALFHRLGTLDDPRTLRDWSETLEGVLDGFLAADEETDREMQAVRGVLRDLNAVCGAGIADFSDPVSLRVVRSHLGNAFEREGFGFGFISGGVTFCAMLPMRSIPFKVICLVGMDNHAYPRQSKAPGFDLMARRPRPGDRSRRNDDRYLFLETVLSARETLYISYVGQDIRDNTPVPPSVLVGELLDYLEQGFQVPGKDVRDHVVTRHRLQAFSPAYFRGDKGLFSYSEEDLRAARCLVEERRGLEPFFSGDLSAPGDDWRRLGVEDLIRFFAHPTRYLLNRRLGVFLDEGAAILEEREAFDLKGLEKYLMEQKLLEMRMQGLNLGDFSAVLRATGQLPHGAVGSCVFETLAGGIEVFAEMLGPYVKGPSKGPLEVDLGLQGFRLAGRIEGVYPEGLVQYRYARISGRDLLGTWIRHLVLNALPGDHGVRNSVLAGLDPDRPGEAHWRAWRFDPVDNPQDILGGLLGIYEAGLVRPVHFFPETSWTFAREKMEKKRSGADALIRARNVWEGSDYSRGEFEDPYYRLCFRDESPVDGAFQETAVRVFGDLLKHGKKVD